MAYRDGFQAIPEDAKAEHERIFSKDNPANFSDAETAAEQSKAFADPEAANINEQAEREGQYHGQ